MNRRVLIIPLAALVLLASCNRDNRLPDDPDMVAVEFRAGISTRASNASWDKNDAIGIYMKSNNQPLSATSVVNQTANLKYVTPAGDGAFTNGEGVGVIYYPVDGSRVDFVAYYPQQSVTNYSVAVDVSNQSNQGAIDLLYSDNAVGKHKLAPVVELNFTHRLSKLAVVLKAGEGVTDADLVGAVVSVSNLDTKAQFSLVDGSLSQPAQRGNIQLKSGSTHEALLLPHSGYASREMTILLADGKRFVWNIPSDKAFVAGQKTIYTITLDRVKVSVSGVIVDWVDQGSDLGGTAVAQ